MLHPLTRILILISLLLSAAIFGFFYAWICSTMWGLDQTDPRVSIAAMQAMNASVRNGVFAPAFFGTPVMLGLAGLALWRGGAGKSAAFFGAGALVYLTLGMGLTMVVHVPLNEALALQEVPASRAEAQAIWDAYSPRWQLWNQIRTGTSGLAFLLALGGVLALVPKSGASARG